ncbi:uncharacterized protein [Linepithema humile]|uniref:uncharacterized protein n=1 Tax=Linepithema humile TaxID=83485 RepID=UPI00351EF7CB
MSKSCYLCDRKPSKNKYISVHGFPKNATLRQKWKNACGLTEKDDVSRIYICSIHFTSENMKVIEVFGNPRIILKPGSVPSISIPSSQFEMILCDKNATSLISDNIIKENATSENVDVCLSSMDSASVLQKPIDLEHMDVDVNSSSQNRDRSNENEIGTPKKRRFHEPRFISEITLLDLSTPRKAQRMLKFIKNKNQEKAKKIQRLQSINRYQKIRITSLENTIKHLKDKGCPMKQKIH